MGNLLKETLFMDDDNVRFVGYKKPHPLDSKIELKIQTVKETKPRIAFRSAIESLEGLNQNLQSQFQQQMKKFAE